MKLTEEIKNKKDSEENATDNKRNTNNPEQVGFLNYLETGQGEGVYAMGGEGNYLKTGRR